MVAHAVDLNAIALIDNHCHPVLREQQMQPLEFRSYFSEATHPDFAQRHISESVYYLWLLRQLADFYHCQPIEDEIIAVRNSMDAIDLLTRLLQDAGIETLILDIGHPDPALCHCTLQSACEQQIPVQFHTGYGDHDADLRQGNPLHLRTIFEDVAYQTLQSVLLHESYPYTRQGAYLAALYPQVYFDLSYMIPFVDRNEMLAFTRQALSIAPASKLMYSSDGIHVPEMYWASARRVRSVVAQVFQEFVQADELDVEHAMRLSQLVLHDTAAELYRL